MADKDDLNDEYQFADLDTVGPETDDAVVADEFTTTQKERRVSAGNNIKRNALIVIALVILAMIIYKILGAYFSERKQVAQNTSAAQAGSPIKEAAPPQPQPNPQQTNQQQSIPSISTTTVTQTTSASPMPSNAIDPQTNQKLSTLELNQQNMQTEIASVSSQIGGITNNVNTLSAQITQLNQMVATLNAKLEEQTHHIQVLNKPRPVKVTRVVRKVVPVTRYYIQAVIPGRAWLISPNGATLTVREGTTIPGYGMVKLIDPHQGRILTSSGQVIRFSQEDS